MKAVLLKGTDLANQVDRYLTEAESLILNSFKDHRKSDDFRDLFKACLAGSTVLAALDSPRYRPSLVALRTIAKRIPLMLAGGQSSVVKVELRRFLEVVFWTLYFTTHPIEWENFIGKRGNGFAKDMRKPITFAAHRELNSYIEYVTELMEVEPSGIALRALNRLEHDKRALNAAVHAGEIARSPIKNVPVDSFDPKEIRKDAALVKRVFGHSLVLLAAFDRRKFNAIPAGPRAYFDWLVGPEFNKAIRSGIFGIESTR